MLNKIKLSNKEYRKLYMQKYRANNLEYVEWGRDKAKEHYENNKDQHKQTSKKYANKISSGVYMIKNLLNGNSYIGQSMQPNRRRTEHFSTLTDNKNQISPPKLQNDMKQYGKTCFVFGVLEHCNENELLTKEQYYINLYKPEYNAN